MRQLIVRRDEADEPHLGRLALCGQVGYLVEAGWSTWLWRQIELGPASEFVDGVAGLAGKWPVA